MQAKVLQSRSCTAATSGHARCGWEAGGWYTAVRDWRPPLHATEHADQADHGPTSHDGVAGTSHWGPVHAAGSSHVHTPGWPRSHSPRPWQNHQDTSDLKEDKKQIAEAARVHSDQLRDEYYRLLAISKAKKKKLPALINTGTLSL